MAVALTASACAGDGADKGTAGANPTLATDPPATTTTNPYAVPATIDAAYVNRVLAGLDAILGDVTRQIIRTRTIPREVYDRLKAVSSDDERLQRSIDGIQRDLRNNLVGYRPDPGNRVSLVTQLISATHNCIFTRVSRDYSAVGTNPLPALDIQWIGLKRLNPSRDPSGYNTTHWVFVYEGFPPDRSQPSDPCTS